MAARALGQALPSFADAVRETAADHDALTRRFLAATLDAGTRGGLTAEAGAPQGTPPSARVTSGGGLEDHAKGQGATGENDMVDKVEIILHLRSLDLFARLTTQELSELASVVREETFPLGGMIVREGDFGDCMYLMVEGEVHVSREGRFVGHLARGDFFGEMALLDGETRSATATAATRVRLLRLERDDLLQLMDERPGIAIAMCQTLSRRVRDLIERLEDGRDEEDGTP